MRALFTILHRYLGLSIAVFLIITGLTGAIISWDHELDEFLNPHLLKTSSLGTPHWRTRLKSSFQRYKSPTTKPQQSPVTVTITGLNRESIQKMATCTNPILIRFT